MNVAFIGTGGVGGFFGAALARVGVNVHLVARGAHLEAIRREGLRVEAASSTYSVRPRSAEADARAVPGCDFVFLCVKHYDLASALAMLRPLAGERAWFIPLLNGVDALGDVSVAFPGRTLGGMCNVISEVVRPGVIRQSAGPRQIVVGEVDRSCFARLGALGEAFARTDVDFVVSNAIETELWVKCIYISCFAGVVAVTRTSIGEVLACAESRALCVTALREAINVARAGRVTLEEGLEHALLARAAALTPDTKYSMLRDLEARRSIEIETFSGAIVRRGRQLGVPTPVHEFLCAALLPAHNRVAAAEAPRRPRLAYGVAKEA